MYLTVLVANLFSGSENLSSADNQQETFIIEGILNDYTPDLESNSHKENFREDIV